MKPDKKARDMSRAELAAYIDQSVLKPEFTQNEIRRYIREGINFGCKTVCVNPSALDIARELCAGTQTGICVVCDFPFGLSGTASKLLQIREICFKREVADLDLVSNYGWIKSGLWKEYAAEIKAASDAVHSYGAIIKVILETDALNPDEIAKATDICCGAGADYVKTSTGFYTGGESRGAAYETIELMLDTAAGRCKVKGSGGIRSREQFLKLIDMGIDRMGIGYRSTPVVLGEAE